MNILKKLLYYKYGWAVFIALFLGITYIAYIVRYRIDLTAEKRFSLTDPTIKLLQKLDKPVDIKVLLAGDLPADYKKLSIATKDLLAEFREQSKQLHITFDEVSEKPEDENVNYFYDSLTRLGVQFEENITSKGVKSTQQLIAPFALVSVEGKKPIAVDLRSSRTIFKQFDVINDAISKEDKEATRNAAEALLEFKFANAINKLVRTYIPVVAYAVGNGEPIDLTVNDLGECLRNEYRLGIFDLKKGFPNPKEIDVLLIVKPTQPFVEEDKLKLDQYVTHGGKIIWFIDKLYAELDSLMRSSGDFVAFDRNLNIDDILFKYGVRINGDLLQDLNCSKIPIVVGRNPDGSPRMQRIPWPYYPFLAANNNNPVSKNIDRVLPIFPSSIDTVVAKGITKTILLASDTNSRVLSSPAMVRLNSVRTEEDFRAFNKNYIPVAVLLEGEFQSLFANRLTPAVRDSFEKASGMIFSGKSDINTKQIVVSDADIVTNSLNKTTGPLSMGMLSFENYRFANREFLLNSIDYLTGTDGLFEARNKNFVLRLLDKRKVEEQRTIWQAVTILAPVLLIVFFGFIFQWVRKNKYGKLKVEN